MSNSVTIISSLEHEGWIYFIGSHEKSMGLLKMRPNEEDITLLYSGNIHSSFLSDSISSIWKIEDGYIFFTVKSALYRDHSNPYDPESCVDHTTYRMKLDGTDRQEISCSTSRVGLYSEP